MHEYIPSRYPPSNSLSSQLPNKGVTASGSHSPIRKLRIHNPGAGAVNATGSGSAVMGRACSSHSLPAVSMAHSMSCGVSKRAATRVAMSAI